jgi:Type II secretory pathway, pseudopilin PulG
MARLITPGNLLALGNGHDQLQPQNSPLAIALGKPNEHKQAGFTYMGILMLMVIAGISMAGAGMVWHTQIQRAEEQQLLFVGNAIRKAISSYYASSPSGVGEYPPTLEALLLDKRQPKIKRHLRRLYADPVGKKQEWVLITQNQKIIGVHSQSLLKPIKVSGFPPLYESFSSAKTYQDWKFISRPGVE